MPHGMARHAFISNKNRPFIPIYIDIPREFTIVSEAFHMLSTVDNEVNYSMHICISNLSNQIGPMDMQTEPFLSKISERE